MAAVMATRMKTGSLPRSRSATKDVQPKIVQTKVVRAKATAGETKMKKPSKKSRQPADTKQQTHRGDPFPMFNFIGAAGFPPAPFQFAKQREDSSDDDQAEEEEEELTDEAAALLLMSVSPQLSAARPRALSHLEPLESLAAVSHIRRNEAMTGSMGSLRDFQDAGSEKGSQGIFSLKIQPKSQKRKRAAAHATKKQQKKTKKAKKSKEPAAKPAKINPECPKDLRPMYGSLYNTGGSAIIERYRNKRRRRVWTKKVRYSCRKNLADNRLRIKGRFVKKDSAEAKAYFAAQAAAAEEAKKAQASLTTDALIMKPVNRGRGKHAKRPRAMSSNF
eukprot:g1572.t1